MDTNIIRGSSAATGTDTYAAVMSVAQSAYQSFGVYSVTFANDNTGASTLNVDTLGAKNIYKNVEGTLTALAAKDIESGVVYNLIYDGTQFQIHLSIITGSGTTDYVARWTADTVLGIGKIRDDGTTIGVNMAPATAMVSITGSGGNDILKLTKSTGGTSHQFFDNGRFEVFNGMSIGTSTPTTTTGLIMAGLSDFIVGIDLTTTHTGADTYGAKLKALTSSANDNIALQLHALNIGAGEAYSLVVNAGIIQLLDNVNMELGTANGTKIGTATTEKIGFWNVTPVIQPATTGTTSGFTVGSGTSVLDDSTFTGGTGASAYTAGDIVLALKQVGILTA